MCPLDVEVECGGECPHSEVVTVYSDDRGELEVECPLCGGTMKIDTDALREPDPDEALDRERDFLSGI